MSSIEVSIKEEEMISETKRDLIEYYDLIKSQIDVTSQTLFINIATDHSDIDNDQEDENELTKTQLLEMNLEYVRVIDEICDQNMLDLSRDNIKNYENKETLKRDVLTKYCIYIINDELNSKNQSSFPIGSLICCDYYLTKAEDIYIRSVFKHNSKKVENDELVTLEVDRNLMNLIGSFQNFQDSTIDLDKFRIIRIKNDEISEYVSTLKEIEINVAPFNSLTEINHIKEDSFNDFVQLEKIKIDGSTLRINGDQPFELKIDRMTFHNLKNLRKIHLYDLKYDILDINTVFSFDNLTNLTKISLTNFNINHIKANTFQNLNHLSHLKLFYLKIGSIETGFFQSIKNLDKLELRFSHIQEPTNDLFHNMNTVTKLRLRSNPIGNKDDHRFDLKNDLINHFSNLRQLEIDIFTFKYLKPTRLANADLIEELGLVFNMIPNQEQLVHVMLMVYIVQSLTGTDFQHFPNLKKIVFKFDGCPDEMFHILKEKLDDGLRRDETISHILIEALYSENNELGPAYLSNHTSKCRFKSS